ncbi:glycosyltransferase family 4 protein [Methanoculleus sp. FWC-SCC1]|uniref:Glycosyltransferase family 4 protein n=1 Tax=Methanoculleus frigidifontis TaxID=2584085 RepID=A0ABT8MBN9_9EURY|nr:glycosyltransferase family 4 protein [Methanoculleus sp. FWC-SCC1]MDN7025353.1 glycosyltransferase family 4 protein [Methanoculleus sp. FWC-SCC1]
MKILALSNHGNTFNPKEGADIRKNKLLLELSRRNDVIVCESDRYIHDKPEGYPNIEVKYYHENYLFKRPMSFLLDINPSFLSILYDTVKNTKIDLIQISFPYGFISTKLLLWLLKKKTPVIYDAHNVESDTVKQMRILDYNLLTQYFFEIYISTLEWLTVIFASDYVISVSDEDRLRFITKYNLNENKVMVIPSGTVIRNHDLDYRKEVLKATLGLSNAKVILFHGTYSYPPNREAFNLIINEIAPRIKCQVADVVFLLAGNGVPIFEKENVKSIGFVEDLDLLLHTADIAIVPLLSGGGTKLKILDYLGAALPIVTTKKGIEGINAVNGKDAIIVDGVDGEFIEAIMCLVCDEKCCKTLGQNGKILAEEQYDWESIGEKLNIFYRKIID